MGSPYGSMARSARLANGVNEVVARPCKVASGCKVLTPWGLQYILAFFLQGSFLLYSESEYVLNRQQQQQTTRAMRFSAFLGFSTRAIIELLYVQFVVFISRGDETKDGASWHQIPPGIRCWSLVSSTLNAILTREHPGHPVTMPYPRQNPTTRVIRFS